MSSYNFSAIRGCGKLTKGSPQAKIVMAYVRAQRGKKNKSKKGGMYCGPKSLPPRGWAYDQNVQGGGVLGTLFKKSLGFWKDYFTNWQQDSDDYYKQKEALMKQKNGGSFELRDLRDGLLGPVGWVRMGVRKKRQRELEKLKQELGDNRR